jgi:hypothetical protein
MYSELTPRILMGGYVRASVDVQLLEWGGVTHIVNAMSVPLPELISGQFITLEMGHANLDFFRPMNYWAKLFSFVQRALYRKNQKLYLHTPPDIPERPEFPVVAYATLLMQELTPNGCRQKLLSIHPLLAPPVEAVASVDAAFIAWANRHNWVICLDKKPKPVAPLHPVDHLDEALPLE